MTKITKTILALPDRKTNGNWEAIRVLFCYILQTLTPLTMSHEQGRGMILNRAIAGNFKITKCTVLFFQISNVSIDTRKKLVTPTIQDEHLACI